MTYGQLLLGFQSSSLLDSLVVVREAKNKTVSILGIRVFRNVRSYVVQHLLVFLDCLPGWSSHYSRESSSHLQTLLLEGFSLD